MKFNFTRTNIRDGQTTKINFLSYPFRQILVNTMFVLGYATFLAIGTYQVYEDAQAGFNGETALTQTELYIALGALTTGFIGSYLKKR